MWRKDIRTEKSQAQLYYDMARFFGNCCHSVIFFSASASLSFTFNDKKNTLLFVPSGQGMQLILLLLPPFDLLFVSFILFDVAITSTLTNMLSERTRATKRRSTLMIVDSKIDNPSETLASNILPSIDLMDIDSDYSDKEIDASDYESEMFDGGNALRNNYNIGTNISSHGNSSHTNRSNSHSNSHINSHSSGIHSSSSSNSSSPSSDSNSSVCSFSLMSVTSLADML